MTDKEIGAFMASSGHGMETFDFRVRVAAALVAAPHHRRL